MNNYEQGSTAATRTPLLGASLSDMLKMANGEFPDSVPHTESSQQLYDELKPRYN